MNERDQQQKPEIQQQPHLKGALTSFEGTAMEPLLRSSLTEAGIDPSAYDPKDHGHYEYMGFPATDPSGYGHETGESPFVSALEVALEKGELVVDTVDYKSIDLPGWTMYPEDGSDPYEGNAYRTSKLTSLGMFSIKNPETDEVLAYAARLGTDGGRPGHAFISTNDVVVRSPAE